VVVRSENATEPYLAARARERVQPQHCPGRKTQFLAVTRAARPHKNTIQNGFTMENAKVV
jgi:hypothetical protein